MIDRTHELPIKRQCQLLAIGRSSYYYQAVPISQADVDLMRVIDEIHLRYPFYGSRKVRNELKARGIKVGRGHVRTLMRKMGIEALYQKPRLSKPNPGHKIYPYLLRNLEISRANQVWTADICYLPMAKGFCYLVAVMDWASRRVLAWRLSNTLDPSFCTEALEEALKDYGAPEIFNTDQGGQFTSEAFTGILSARGIKISMDGKGRWMDNVFIERLWKSVKYEEIYLKGYDTIAEAKKELGVYFEFYNRTRPHQGLDDRTPDVVYWASRQRSQVAA